MSMGHIRAVVIWIGLLACIAILGLIDWKTGFELNFFTFYFLPVGLSAWYLGAGPSLIISVISSVVWYGANELTGQTYSHPAYAVWNTIIRLVSFLAIGWSLATIRKILTTERAISSQLRQSLAELKVLKGLLPICAQCKKIRTDQGIWQHMEVYFSQHSNAQFSHGYCPECLKKALEEADLSGKQREEENRS